MCGKEEGSHPRPSAHITALGGNTESLRAVAKKEGEEEEGAASACLQELIKEV